MNELDQDLLTEVFDIRSAKGYDFTVTDMSTVTVPEITFEALFTADNGVEYAFRAYMSNYLPGRKYGRHTRVLAFMRRKTKKFSQNFTVDPGTFKKVLVTFFKCYEVYKASKDGQRASSYAVMLQGSIAKYAPLFVRVSNRAFKTERRIKLDLFGVNPEAKGGGVELFYVNPMSVHPYFGGKDFNEDTYTKSQLYLDLAKLPSVDDVEPVAASSVPTSQVVSEPTDNVRQKRDPLNPDGIPGLNDPANFNEAFIKSAFTAPGRDELEAVFKAHLIHRRYFQANIDTALTIWDNVKGSINVWPMASDVIEGVGFYLKRADIGAFKRVITEIAIESVKGLNYPTDEIEKLISSGAIDTTVPFFDTISSKVINEFLGNGLFPVQHDVKERLNRLQNVLRVTGGSITPSMVLAWPVSATSRLFAGVALNSLGVEGFDNSFFSNDEFESLLSVVDNSTVEVKDKENVLRKIGVITSRYGEGSVKFVELKAKVDTSDNDFIKALKANDSTAVNDVFVALNLGVKSDESHAKVNEILSVLEYSRDIDADSAVSTLNGAMNLSSLYRSAPEYTNINYCMMMATLASREDSTAEAVRVTFGHMMKLYGRQYEIVAEVLGDSVERSYEQLIKVVDGSIGSPIYNNTSIVAKVKEVNTTHEYTTRNAESFIAFIESKVSILDNWRSHILLETLIGTTGELSLAMLTRLYNAVYEKSITGFKAQFNTHITTAYSNPDTIEQFVLDLYGTRRTSSYVLRFLGIKGNVAYTVGIYRAMAKIRATMVNDDIDTSGNEVSIVDLALKGDAVELESLIGRDVIVDAVKNNVRRLYASSDSIGSNVPEFVVDAIVDGVDDIAQSPNFNRTSRWSYDIYSSEKTAVVKVLSLINADMINVMSDSRIETIKRIFGQIDATQTTKRSQYQPMLDQMADLLSEADRSNVSGLAQDLLDVCGDREKRLLVKSIGKNLFFNRYMKELKESNIGINVDLNKKMVSNILNFNNISMAKLPNLTEKDNVETARKKVAKVDLGVPEEKVEKINLTKEQLEDLTIEYDAFNRRKHNLSLVIEESFNVSIPSQITGRAEWDAQMREEGIDSKIISPVFHGTGSVAAAMILRLGFAVSNLNETQKTGVKVAGRMLGDGIYFSTAIDKVAQYASDGGYGRRIGESGYIFEMNASLGKHRRDFREGGTGTRYDERHSLVSPEWAVFNPNKQLVITKAHKIKRVPHYVIDNMKKSRNLKESENVTAIRGFRDVIREALGYEDNTHMVTFIFGDGFIPIGNGELIDFADAKHDMLGKDVRIEGGQLGAMVTFTKAVVSEDEIDIYYIDSVPNFIDSTEEVKELYFRLLGK